ncbi:hypothetical protein J2T13_001041 [Paenibacillus sp. DS2015]|uniref:copper amine oxidase N-terminal domain-containing protein n=1 Tax=Paenibacillus sp. DS2015 TaxID=3373917 RepID=UPI003D1B0BAD
MTRKLMILLCLTLLLPILNVANAESKIQISVEGEKLSLSQPPIVVKGTTLVPITPVLKKLGLSVEAKNNIITAKKEGIVITLQPGSKVATVNGISFILSEPVQIIKGTTMAPLRLLSETLGSNITSNGNTISISDKQGNSIYYNNLPLTLSGKYVVNKTKDLLEVKIVDFFYNPGTQRVNEYDYFSSIIGFNSGTSKKYNDYVVAQSTHEGGIYLGSAIKLIDHYDEPDIKSTSYEKAREHYRSKEYLAQVIKLVQTQIDTFNANLKKELIANKNIPLKVEQATVTYNSIGNPEVNLTIKNLTSKTIIAYEMSLRTYDDFDRRANNWLSTSNLFEGISQDNSIGSGSYQTDTWTLNFYDLATQVKSVKITAVRFSDGTTWR